MSTLNELSKNDPEITAKLLSRREALANGAVKSSSVLAGLATASIPVALAALARDVFAQGGLPGSVAEVLNFALTLEYLEAEFYTTGTSRPGLLTGGMAAVFDQIRKHEVAHVAFLLSALGSQAVAKPRFDFTGGGGKGNGPFADVFSSPQTFAAVAQAFEDTGVRAYKGQAANLMGSDAILQAALQIHSVEARHAAEVRKMRQQKGWIVGNSSGGLPSAAQGTYNGEDNRFHFILAQPASGISLTEAFDEPLSRGQVMAIVTPFIAIG